MVTLPYVHPQSHLCGSLEVKVEVERETLTPAPPVVGVVDALLQQRAQLIRRVVVALRELQQLDAVAQHAHKHGAARVAAQERRQAGVASTSNKQPRV